MFALEFSPSIHGDLIRVWHADNIEKMDKMLKTPALMIKVSLIVFQEPVALAKKDRGGQRQSRRRKKVSISREILFRHTTFAREANISRFTHRLEIRV